MGALTKRREQFCREYVVDFCGAKAARRAGYSQSNAGSYASDLLKEPEVRARIAELTSIKNEKREDLLQQRRDRVIEELLAVAFADISEFLEWGPDGYKLNPSIQLTAQQTAAVLEVSETVSKMGITRSIKLHPKLRALEMLMRELGMKGEELNVKHSGSVRFMPPTSPPTTEAPDDVNA